MEALNEIVELMITTTHYELMGDHSEETTNRYIQALKKDIETKSKIIEMQNKELNRIHGGPYGYGG